MRLAGLLVLGLAVLALPASAGDWSFYRHDTSGWANPGEPLTAAQAARFQSRLFFAAGTLANIVVSQGTVYITSNDGYLHAVDQATGTEKWKFYAVAHGPFYCFPGSDAGSTKKPVGAPAVVGSTVYFPGGDGVVYALDAATGNVLWRTPIADVPGDGGEFLWASALPVGGNVYVGVGALDDCLLIPGREVALDQTTGRVTAEFLANSDAGTGVGIWATPVYDPASNKLFVATGNVGNVPLAQQPFAQSIVALDPATLAPLDHFMANNGTAMLDMDFGASPTLFDMSDGGHMIADTNKNGWVYAFFRDNLAAGPVWTYQVSGYSGDPDVGLSTIVSPAWANGTLFVGGTLTPDGGQSGAVAALDPDTGIPKWLFYPPNGGWGLAALTAVGDTLVFEATRLPGQPGTLYVLDQSNGSLLYSQNSVSAMWGEPTYANGVLYFGDLAGEVWALTPGDGGLVSTDGGFTDGGLGDGGQSGTTHPKRGCSCSSSGMTPGWGLLLLALLGLPRRWRRA